MKKFILNPLVLLVNLFLFNQSFLFSQSSGYKIVDTIKIGGEQHWDYLSIYQPGHLLFVSHGSEVDVINPGNNTVQNKITGLKGVHGIVFAPDFNEGFISDGRDNSIVVFNLKNFKIMETVKSTGENPDAILYDPYTKRIFAFNGSSSNATVIDAKLNKTIGTITLSGSPEFAVSDFKGHIYVNIENKNEIDFIDPQSLQVVKTIPISPCENPTGMAIDRINHKLFIGGRNKILAVVDADSGKVIANFPIGSGVDACGFDPQTHLIFCSNRDGTLSIIKQNSEDKYSFLKNIQTVTGARTMALDEETHKIYSSTVLDSDKNEKIFSVLVLDNK